jgi:hypothetical protein
LVQLQNKCFKETQMFYFLQYFGGHKFLKIRPKSRNVQKTYIRFYCSSLVGIPVPLL